MDKFFEIERYEPKNIYYFEIYCNNCKNKQKTWSKKSIPTGSRKCVYCGKSITLNRKKIKRL